MREQILKIYMNAIFIGSLKKDKQGGLHFNYDKSWLDTPGARPISLSLPLISKTFTGNIVYNFFDNLLPDNKQIRGRIQAKFHVPTNHPFDLLASIGKDCVGAIQIIEQDYTETEHSIKYSAINEKRLAAILRGYNDNPLGMTTQFEDFRISIAGAQEKAAFLFHNNTWNIPLDETPTSHIFKLPIGIIPHQNLDLSDSCENEWLCSKIANAFGFNVANCQVETFEDVKALVVERFDRKMASNQKWIMRLPQEDLCQALGVSSNLKYQSDGGPGIGEIMKLLLGSETALQDRDVFFKAQILFWILCAIDGHAKNFSIFIGPEGKFQLTPLYDIMSAFPLIENKQLQKRKVKMAMALKGKNTHYHWHEASRVHFLETAKHSGYSAAQASSLLDFMLDQIDVVIDKVGGILPNAFPERVAAPIFSGMQGMKARLA